MARRGRKHKRKQQKGAGAARAPTSAVRSSGSRTPALATTPRSAQQPKASVTPAIPVWDLAIRLFHWSLVVAVCFAWVTGGTGGGIHELAGYTVAGLVAFRLTWGFVGTRYARFTEFVASPLTIIAYLRTMVTSHPRRYLGHNPAGGAMIFALLALIVALSITGWLMLTPQYFGVPWVENLHELSANALLIAIPLHLAGVIGSSIMHRENLVLAMITGNKPLSTPVSHQKMTGAQTQPMPARLVLQGIALLLVLAMLGFGYGWITTSRRVSTPVANSIEPATHQARQ